VAAFFIADVGNGLILGCSSEFESSVCSQVLSDITAYFEFTFSTVESRTLTPSILVRIQVPQPVIKYLDIAYIVVFPGSLFSREFAGLTGLVFKAIRGRDGCTRDFGRGRL
jgi:hypothetical protein